jgi:hypothetical protein
VYVPAADAKNVTESGVAISEAKGVRLLKMEGSNAVLQVQSGAYQFVSK